VLENRVLRIFRPTRDEETRKLRKLHNEELNNLYSSPNIVLVIKLRRMRWVEHMEESWGMYRVLVGKPEGKKHSGDPFIDDRIIMHPYVEAGKVQINTNDR
jgi:hypothetical protein